MKFELLDAIKNAVTQLEENPSLNKVSGPKWMVYRVGKIIRIDIKYE